MVVIVGYLPPENSKFGRDATSFLNHISGILHRYETPDLVVIAGDMNARIGDKCDTIESLDEVKTRVSIDNISNQHGNSLLEFLKETRLCTLNGRFLPNKDAHTSISTRGTAVVDYLICPIENLHMFSDFEVTSCASIVRKLSLGKLLNKRCKIPDHAIVSATFSYSASQNMTSHENDNNTPSMPKYNLRDIPASFMGDAVMIKSMIEEIESVRSTQLDIDEKYEGLVNSIQEQMRQNLQISHKKTKVGGHYGKPFWNEELQSLFNRYVQTERTLMRWSHLRFVRSSPKIDNLRSVCLVTPTDCP